MLSSFVIPLKGSKENFYIQSATLNCKAYNKSFITFEDLQNGGELYFEMDKIPNKNWANDADSIPYSLSLNSK